MLRPAVSHSGGEKPAISRPNQSTESVSQTDGNTGSFQIKSNSNSASTNSVTESATTYKEKQIHVSVPDNNTKNHSNTPLVAVIGISETQEQGNGTSIIVDKKVLNIQFLARYHPPNPNPIAALTPGISYPNIFATMYIVPISRVNLMLFDIS